MCIIFVKADFSVLGAYWACWFDIHEKGSHCIVASHFYDHVLRSVALSSRCIYTDIVIIGFCGWILRYLVMKLLMIDSSVSFLPIEEMKYYVNRMSLSLFVGLVPMFCCVCIFHDCSYFLLSCPEFSARPTNVFHIFLHFVLSHVDWHNASW